MTNIRILIVEDNSLIAEGISATLKRNFFDVVSVCRSGEEAIDAVVTMKPDIVLMDIKLEGTIDGISAAKIINEKSALPVIYLTDFTDKETVERAKTTFPSNYLSKPFNDVDLIRSVELAFYNFYRRQIGSKVKGDSIFIKSNSLKYIKVLYSSILYLQAGRAYCKVVTEEQTFDQTKNMNYVHEQLDPEKFVRVHRSYVVNVDKITGIEGNMLFLGKHSVAMSAEHRQEILSRLKFI